MVVGMGEVVMPGGLLICTLESPVLAWTDIEPLFGTRYHLVVVMASVDG